MWLYLSLLGFTLSAAGFFVMLSVSQLHMAAWCLCNAVALGIIAVREFVK